MPGGRPTKFKEEHMDKIKKMALAGFTDAEMADLLSVTEQTFNNWKKSQPEFFESLKDWKVIADGKVERSLFERAIGYEHCEEKIFNANGEPLIVDTIKHYPPDAASAIFWLKNRQPKKWRDKHDIDLKANVNIYADMTEEDIEKELGRYEKTTKD